MTRFAADYATHRPRTIFLPFFVSDVSDQDATLCLLEHNTLVSSGNCDFTQRYGNDATTVGVKTITLNDLLEHQRVTQLDFVNMDIELWEPKALSGFDLLWFFKPALVCIEAHPEVRQWILDDFAARGYTVVGKYLRVDQHNLYFTPRPVEAGS